MNAISHAWDKLQFEIQNRPDIFFVSPNYKNWVNDDKLVCSLDCLIVGQFKSKTWFSQRTAFDTVEFQYT